MFNFRSVLFTVSGVLAFLTLISPISHSSSATATDDGLVRITSNLPFTMRPIGLPQIPKRSISVAEFGAIGDGLALNTTAFAKAIEACAKSGGGRVVVPQAFCWYSQNGDGLDLDSCRRAVVFNCRFDVGDDAICLKSGRDEYGRKRGRPCEEIVISDCVVYHGHGGFTVGSEMSGGVRNVSVRRCTFLGTDLGIRFKTTRGRGGVVERIWISDISACRGREESEHPNKKYRSIA